MTKKPNCGVFSVDKNGKEHRQEWHEEFTEEKLKQLVKAAHSQPEPEYIWLPIHSSWRE